MASAKETLVSQFNPQVNINFRFFSICLKNFFLANVYSNVKLFGEYDKKDGKTFLSVKERKISIKIGSLKIHFSNLFNGNKQLSKWNLLLHIL